jgi:dTDP-glucose 4,6-dehydratase
MIKNALQISHYQYMEKGENVRDWLHVYDHCTAIDLIIHNGRIGQVYNIGGHNERTNIEVVKTILRELKKPDL